MRQLIDLITEAQGTYYHGSKEPLAIGTVLTAQDEGYVRGHSEWTDIENQAHHRCEQIIEQFRPANAPSRFDAVFLVTDPQDIDYAGGYDDHVYIVEPQGEPWKANLNWYSELYILCEHTTIDPKVAREHADNYWAAVPKGGSDLYEYLVTSATIVSQID